MHEGGLPWEVYDSKTNQPILKFNTQPLVDYYAYYDNGWNPHSDDLIVVQAVTKGVGTVELYNIQTRTRIMTVEAEQFDGWTANGRQLVFSDGRKLKFVPMTPTSSR